MPKPRVIYEPKPGSPIAVDRPSTTAWPARPASRTLVERFVVPMRSGRAWPVRAGQLFRIVAVEGPQVADFNAWSLGNPRERFWAARTKQLHRAHVTTYDRLWSCLPYLRPMLTITNDTIRYGRDEDGAGCHDLLGTRCDPYVHKMLNGEDFDLCCHSNLVRAVAPYRLNELDVHDVLNIFQVTGLTADDRYFIKASPAKQGGLHRVLRRDRRAVRDLDLSRAAISRCRCGAPTRATRSPTCRPLGVEIWQPDRGPARGLAVRPARRTIAGTTVSGAASAGRRTGSPWRRRAMLTIPARRGMAARVGQGPARQGDQHARRAGGGHLGVQRGGHDRVDVDGGSRAWFMKLRAALGDTFLTNQRRPILTLVEDTSGGAHDTLMAACDAPRYRLLGVEGHHDNCRDNLHAGLAALGVKVPATPSPLNLFMNIPWTPDGTLAWAEPVSTAGSYVVLRAEMDLVIAFSACPQDILPINGRTGQTTEAHFTIE